MRIFTQFFAVLLCLIATSTYSQDTFSIVALDSITGEVGSAGASCIDANNVVGGVRVISDIISGRGAIHTQASYHPSNKTNARNRMLAGDSPSEIINWLIANDIFGTPDVRQYGIVDFDPAGHPRVAAYTGVNCMDYKSHIIGPNYAIQGNILLGQEILDSMENRFLNTSGTLADKLMAALQGANVPGADTRCLSEGVSSLSAFLRVSRPSDPVGFNYVDLLVDKTPFGVEPIDSLQTLFDAWTPPQCDATIPNDAMVIDSVQTVNSSNQSYWVCEGDTLNLTGNNNTVFLESKAVLVGNMGNNNRIYVKDSAAFDGGSLLLPEVYFLSGSKLINSGLAPTYYSCDSIVYDYTVAPENGCLDNTNRLEENQFQRLGWKVFPNPAEGIIQLQLNQVVTENGEISVFDLTGKKVFVQKIEPGMKNYRIELNQKISGFYFLQIKIDDRAGVEKWMIR